MKKLSFIVWLCILTFPTLLIFSTNEQEGITVVNFLALAYIVLLSKFWRKMMPRYMREYIERTLYMS